MNKEQIMQVPSPCYVMEEALLRRNLALISRVAKEAGVEIILAFKAFALWKSFPIFRTKCTALKISPLPHSFGNGQRRGYPKNISRMAAIFCP